MEGKRMARLTKEERLETKRYLQEAIKEGDTIYTIVKKVDSLWYVKTNGNTNKN